MSALSLVTIAAGNRLSGAAVVCQSFLDQHPDGHAAVVLLDDVVDLVRRLDPRIEILSTADLPVDPEELTDLTMLYGPGDLARALRPAAVLGMLERRPGVVFYLDTDMEVHAPLREVADIALSSGVALTPHRFEPAPSDGALPTEEHLLAAGFFNPGFIAAAEPGRATLEQWWDSLRRNTSTGQRWFYQAMALDTIAIVSELGCNVGYWNIDARPVRKEGPTGWTAAGSPLRIFHFSGFDPLRPWVLSDHLADAPRVALSDEPDLAELCSAYARRLLAAGWEDARRLPYGHAPMRDGTTIDVRMREVYSQARERAESRGAPAPPNPFRAGQIAAFWQLLNEPHPDHPRVSRYLFELWRARPDVGAAIGSLQRESADHFADWLLDHNNDDELRIPARLLPERASATRFRERASGPPPRKEGLAVVGFIGADLGVGQAARLAIEAAQAAGLEPEVIAYDNTLSRSAPIAGCTSASDAVADVALVCLNPDVLPHFIDASWPHFGVGRRIVGLWFWEVDVPTPSIQRAFDLVDEVWVTTDYVRSALASVATKPVEVIALPLLSERAVDLDDPRERLGIPCDRFMFLFTYDALSVAERKNPLGLLKAFSMAFAPDDGPILVIKTINGAGHEVTEHLKHLAATRPDVMIVDHYLTSDELLTLVAVADCYVSLHRAEGWGLTLAEALAAGTPVIATGYSGNTEFMDDENSYLIPYELVPVGPGNEPYPARAVWAEPDLLAAAAAMRKVWEQPDEASRVARRAAQDMMRDHTPTATAGAFGRAVVRARARRETRS